MLLWTSYVGSAQSWEGHVHWCSSQAHWQQWHQCGMDSAADEWHAHWSQVLSHPLSSLLMWSCNTQVNWLSFSIKLNLYTKPPSIFPVPTFRESLATGTVLATTATVNTITNTTAYNERAEVAFRMTDKLRTLKMFCLLTQWYYSCISVQAMNSFSSSCTSVTSSYTSRLQTTQQRDKAEHYSSKNA